MKENLVWRIIIKNNIKLKKRDIIKNVEIKDTIDIIYEIRF